MIFISVNGIALLLDVDPETPLLWVLRDTLVLYPGNNYLDRVLSLNCTKYGCGIACGAGAVPDYGKAVRNLPILPETLRAV